MATQTPGPRKRRTRQHVIADLSVHHVDLLVSTFDEEGYVEPGSIYFQLKAREVLDETAAHFAYDVDIRDYNLWIREKMPVIFILFDASRRRAYWLAIQDYFGAEDARRPRKGARTVRVLVPGRQVVNGRAIARMRELKAAALRREQGEES
jgi:hypothetical protein